MKEAESNEKPQWIIPKDVIDTEIAMQTQKLVEYTINRVISISVATGIDIQHVLDNFEKFDDRFQEKNDRHN